MVNVLKNVRPYGADLTDIVCENGKITFIGKTDKEGRDMKGKIVFPGLIDIHSHGADGLDTMDGKEAVEKIAKWELCHGITTYYPTTMTVAFEDIEAVVNSDVNDNGRAHVVGYHIEGPYINVKYKGAQNAEYVKRPDIREFKKLKKAALVTVAPEVDGALDFISECDCVVCLGHSAATFAQAKAGFDKGAKCVTHTFNAMPGFHHRDTSIIGAAIESDAYAQLICDGLHVSRPAVTMLYKTFGKDRLVLISDSMRATGLGDGEYVFGGQKVIVKDGAARTEEGALAGSTTDLFHIVKKAIEFGIPTLDAFYMATETPAKLMGLNKGRIAVGYDSDFIVLDDNYDLIESLIL